GAPGVAGSGSEIREVASHHCPCRDVRYRIARVLASRRALIAAKEKELVLKNRSAESAAELIALESAALHCKILASIQQVIAHQLKSVPVKLIGTRLRHSAHLRAASLRGSLPPNFSFEFGQRVREWKR